jgi:ribonuclease HII
MDNISTIVGGDSKSLSIATASIFAKVTRDRFMDKLDQDYPNYLWRQNKGYGTKQHIDAIKKFGITPYHRKSFLKKIIG